jgi:hypothetical protein
MMPEKIEISLSQFLDFSLSQQGSSRVSCVRRIKNQPGYHPAMDFWKQLRDTIRELHIKGHPIDSLPKLMPVINERKKNLYSEAIKNYVKLIRKHQIDWFEPGKSHWSTNGLLVRTSPELGLIIDNQPRLVKLYFKGHGEKATKRNISETLTMMSTSEFQHSHTEAIVSVISIAQSRMFQSDRAPTFDNLLALKSDAEQFTFIWNQL